VSGIAGEAHIGAAVAPAHDVHCAVITAPYVVKGGGCDRVPKRHHDHIDADTKAPSLTDSVAFS